MSETRAWVVERFNWAPHTRSYQAPDWTKGTWARLPGATRVASFTGQAAAEDDCLRREQMARAAANPFAFGGPALHYQTSLDEGRLCDWLLDAGLTPPTTGKDRWWKWWKKHSASMTELQRLRLWEALDKVRFFRVAEALAPVVFVVAEVFWDYNDEFHYRSPDGHRTQAAYTTREKADAARWKLEQAERGRYNPFEMNGHGPWSIWSSLPEDAFLEQLDKLRLRRPEPKSWNPSEYNWEDWWPPRRATKKQLDAVWAMLDRIEFYEVIEVEMPA